VELSGWVVVGLGGNCDWRCGILYAPMLGGGGGFLGDWLVGDFLFIFWNFLFSPGSYYNDKIQYSS